jgi:hypothetical protein
MDLVVNAVVKSTMRRHRIQLLMSYFREYRSQCHLAQRATPPMPYPDFDPPPPSIIDGHYGMFDLRERSLLQDTFRLSVSRVFQSVGLSPMVSDPIGTFVTDRGPQTSCSVRRDHFRKDSICSTEDQLIAKKPRPLVACCYKLK